MAILLGYPLVVAFLFTLIEISHIHWFAIRNIILGRANNIGVIRPPDPLFTATTTLGADQSRFPFNTFIFELISAHSAFIQSHEVATHFVIIVSARFIVGIDEIIVTTITPDHINSRHVHTEKFFHVSICCGARYGRLGTARKDGILVWNTRVELSIRFFNVKFIT
jgi:hypothetical protein